MMTKIAFVHPDLGIGGAERLIVDACLALQQKGHTVCIFTAHHSQNHCFPETKNGQLHVKCVGDWLPRSTLGKLAAFWAYVRMIYVAIYLVFFSKFDFKVAFVDQISVCIPFIKLKTNIKVIFYCHFPDQLLTQRKSLLKKFYRYVIDKCEELTTGLADCIFVNSEFTSSVFSETFPSIKITPFVLYPSLDFSRYDNCASVNLSENGIPLNKEFLFLSVNRYERKKNIPLALRALSKLLHSIDHTLKTSLHLIIVGGYDDRVSENVSHYIELVKLAEDLNIRNYVTFLCSPSDVVKINLYKTSTCVLYTPDLEHFGIVPIEAMYCKIPVIAVNSGGPKESIANNITGFLCEGSEDSFSKAMLKFINDKTLSNTMGVAGYERVLSKFSFSKFSDTLDITIRTLLSNKKTR